jgi:hypothetical protein
MAAWRIGRAVVRGLFRETAVWLCAAVLLAALCLARAELLGVRAQTAQQSQAAGDGAASQQQNGGQATGGQQDAGQPATPSIPLGSASSSTPVDGADELLKEFPGDSTSKAATDPRDGHPANEPAPLPEDIPPDPDTAQPAAIVAAPPAAAAPARPVLIELPADPRQRQVAIECNDLLTMAADLKTAVDKSTKDQLSLEVVRKAGQLEQYARKVRTGATQTAGK